MPKVDKYLEGFGLQLGSYLDGYILSDISIDHVVIKRYREYQYPTVMVWRVYDQTADYHKLIQDLVNYLKNDRTIFTSYGNPYRCNFGELRISSVSSVEVVITTTGVCRRIFTS